MTKKKEFKIEIVLETTDQITITEMAEMIKLSLTANSNDYVKTIKVKEIK